MGNKFIYLVAFEKDGMLAFDYCAVYAADKDAAYAVGMREHDDAVMKRHNVAKLSNNLVIDMDDLPECGR